MTKIVESIGSALGFGGESSVQHAGDAQAAGVREQIGYLQGAEQRATERLQPYDALGKANLPEFQRLLTPQGQYDYAMSNPLLAGAFKEIGQQVGTGGAAVGKFNSGDTLNALFNKNYGLINSIGQQGLSNYLMPIQIGQNAAAGTASNIMNTGQQVGNAFSNIGDINAATILGRQNAQAALGGNLLQGAGSILSFLSDRRTKTDIVEIERDEIGGIYEFNYKSGGPRMRGRMADELQLTRPDAVKEVGGYLMVSAEFAPEEI